ncbi:hypothetical protein ACE38W_00620 [Chitinophaga sp. Hz27]|uniref:hypothetical protein n=1 Tax=Chitinophaga sp. Hz27 TaxID=3347169 RepID=UPI0035E3AC6C
MGKQNKQPIAEVSVHQPSQRVLDRLLHYEEASFEHKDIEIKSGNLKDGMFCHYSYEHTVQANTTNNLSCKSQVPVHEDLIAAFKLFNVHLAVICEEINPDDIPAIDNLPKLDTKLTYEDPAQDPLAKMLDCFSVSSFRIAANGENEGVILSGLKRLSTGEYVKLETPVTKFQSDYAFTHELRLAVFDVLTEIEEYMKGKQAPPRQTELDFETQESDINDEAF